MIRRRASTAHPDAPPHIRNDVLQISSRATRAKWHTRERVLSDCLRSLRKGANRGSEWQLPVHLVASLLEFNPGCSLSRPEVRRRTSIGRVPNHATGSKANASRLWRHADFDWS